jgi:hypothetical protein
MPKSTDSAAVTGLPSEQPLSSLIRDPFVRAAFERAERDQGLTFAVTPPRAPELTGGAAEQIEMEKADV